MGRLISEETFRIENDFGEPFGAYEIEIKRFWSVGDQEFVESQQLGLSIQTEGKQAKINDAFIRTGRVAIAERLIKSWNVTDDDDKALSVTLQNIRKLPSEVLDWILAEWDKRQDKKK